VVEARTPEAIGPRGFSEEDNMKKRNHQHPFKSDQREFPRFSRRAFTRMASALAGVAALPFYNESSLAFAQLSKTGPMPPDAVKINANENPLGPCPAAVEAAAKIIKNGGRYSYELTDELEQLLAEREDLDVDYVRAFAGSSDPLHRAVMAFTSPAKPLISANPDYEAAARGASVRGAKVIRLPLTQTWAHDVKAMVKAAEEHEAGLIYICNPNNPTGTVTPRADIEYLVNNKPADTVVLLDEAYIHFCEQPSGADLVSMDRDVIVLRTFSKLYGMAGMRCGVAMARPDLLERLNRFGAGALPITGVAAATASLKVKTLVPERRRIVKDVREDLFAFMEKNNISFVPSVSNFFMLDAGVPARRLIRAMQKEKVYIGRVWPAMPTCARITIGTREEMTKFKTALLKVMPQLQI
jgi:histidinol-phosphate aminotransferase